MTRREIIEGIKNYVNKNNINKSCALYSKEGVEILLNYFEEASIEIENRKNSNKLLTFNDK